MDAGPAARIAQILDSWVTERVAVRIVTEQNDLVAVFSGHLRARRRDAEPPWFWPVGDDGAAGPSLERHGIYAHPSLVAEVRLHEGGFVVEYLQRSVSVNVRRVRPRNG